jgi:hypothetical protein
MRSGHETFLNGTGHALPTHTRRMFELELEPLRRFPDRVREDALKLDRRPGRAGHPARRPVRCSIRLTSASSTPATPTEVMQLRPRGVLPTPRGGP